VRRVRDARRAASRAAGSWCRSSGGWWQGSRQVVPARGAWTVGPAAAETGGEADGAITQKVGRGGASNAACQSPRPRSRGEDGLTPTQRFVGGALSPLRLALDVVGVSAQRPVGVPISRNGACPRRSRPRPGVRAAWTSQTAGAATKPRASRRSPWRLRRFATTAARGPGPAPGKGRARAVRGWTQAGCGAAVGASGGSGRAQRARGARSRLRTENA
jgi:hypothetical protein